jgi:hypothetical protein
LAKVIQEDLSKYTPEERAQIEKMLGQQAKIEVAGVKAEVTKDDSWETIGMIVVLVLALYLGIKLINKYIK